MSTFNVDTDNKLEDVTNHLNKKYPYLKLEFFNHSHENFEGNKMDDRIELDKTVGDCGGKAGDLTLENSMTVGQLEDQIKENLGLNAQVFRHSGKVWLETTTTDDWTLEEQNSRGEEAFH